MGSSERSPAAITSGEIFSLTGDNFTVKAAAGVEVSKCKGKVLSISDKSVGS